jgi:sporulation protein YlmC with PRC-barrel domain
MRASDLIGSPVVREDGRRIGVVTGLRCTLDGPSAGAVPAPRIQELVVAPRRTGAWLGYQQRTQRGPWLIRVVLTALHPRTEIIAWSEIADIGPGRVTLRDSGG